MKNFLSVPILVFIFCSCQLEQESLIQPNFEVKFININTEFIESIANFGGEDGKDPCSTQLLFYLVDNYENIIEYKVWSSADEVPESLSFELEPKTGYKYIITTFNDNLVHSAKPSSLPILMDSATFQATSNKTITVDLQNKSGLLTFEQEGKLPFYSHLNIEFMVQSYWYIDPQMGELITENDAYSYSFDISINQTMRAHEPIYLRKGNTISKVRVKHFDLNRNVLSVREFNLSNPLTIEKDMQYDLKILVDKILTNNGAEGFEWQVSE